jgi:hypothetical protein
VLLESTQFGAPYGSENEQNGYRVSKKTSLNKLQTTQKCRYFSVNKTILFPPNYTKERNNAAWTKVTDVS